MSCWLNCCLEMMIDWIFLLQRDFSNQGTWKKIIQSQLFFENKKFSRFFRKWTNTIYYFEGC